MATALTTMRWDEREGATARGTVIVLAGRGESPAVYARLGQRLTADAYRVRAVGDLTGLEIDAGLLVRSLIAESVAHPTVLIGSDTGALLALQLASESEVKVDALVTAGLPVGPSVLAKGADAIEARSVCPVHRLVLTNPDAVDPLAYANPVPPALSLSDPATIEVPVLGIHGADDAIVALESAREYYAAIGESAVLKVVHAGHHDILNDISHRSVAATIVLFLEQLRNHGTPTTHTETFGPNPSSGAGERGEHADTKQPVA